MDSSQHYLLIVACSQRKRSDVGFLPAIERYDGGNYRLLRKARREGYWPKRLDVLILSAKYGLIEASTPIANYEQRMNKERASELKAQTMQALQSYAQQNAYNEVYVDLGQDYIFTVEGVEKLFNDSLVRYAKGRIGERLFQLKTWIVEKCKET